MRGEGPGGEGERATGPGGKGERAGQYWAETSVRADVMM